MVVMYEPARRVGDPMASPDTDRATVSSLSLERWSHHDAVMLRGICCINLP
jgi:hypothetical protein